MKLIVIGGVAAGASAAVKARRTSEDWEIVIYEKGDFISYANCGMPYYIGNVIKDRDDLIVVTPEYLKRRFNIEVKTKHEVLKILPEQKKIIIKDILSGIVFEDKYDKLIIATGAVPFVPDSIKGQRVFPLYTLSDMDKIKKFIDENRPEKALILGGGFIGIEMAENLKTLGMKVTIVEKMSQILSPFDEEMAQIVKLKLLRSGINVITGAGVEKIDGKKAFIENGMRIEFDIAIASLGVKPNSKLALDAGISLGLRDSIKVNKFMETSIKDIFAAGDVAENFYQINSEPTWIPLAGSANKQGRIAGYNAVSLNKKEYKGTLGTAIAKFENCVFATTGFNEKKMIQERVDYISFYLVSEDHASYYPGSKTMYIKVIGDKNGRVLGAQIVGEEGVDKRIDVFASAIYAGFTFQDLESLDLAYAPPFSSARDPVIVAGMIGNNIIKGEMPALCKLDDTVKDAIIIDVRTKKEFERGCLEGAINMPIDEFRNKIEELKAYRDKKIIVNCATGYRSYIVTRQLLNRGFKDVYNLSGGYVIHGAKNE
jgi:NADPH-dependent 2,4-dienoyl-CoA reductase/sulfur reductase-like enzyme/rhodanese-related sulfurtransferase